MMTLRPEFFDCGESALLVDFGSRVDKELSVAILNLTSLLSDAAIAGIVEAIPAFSSLTIFYDPFSLAREDLVSTVRRLCEAARGELHGARRWEIPVRYGSDQGIDLPEAAARTGQGEAALVELHSSQLYHVYMLGFLPGFAYMGDLPRELQLPRRATPRARVPAGSVAIAAEMTAIYPLESPGGWHLIGWTPIPLWDMTRMDEPLLRPGDKVSFKPVGADEAAALTASVAAGWLPEPVEAP
jgi:KipI family sensor histidine kinase inhibitor